MSDLKRLHDIAEMRPQGAPGVIEKIDALLDDLCGGLPFEGDSQVIVIAAKGGTVSAYASREMDGVTALGLLSLVQKYCILRAE